MTNCFGCMDNNFYLWLLIILFVLCCCGTGCITQILDKICGCGCLIPILLLLYCYCGKDKGCREPKNFGLGCGCK